MTESRVISNWTGRSVVLIAVAPLITDTLQGRVIAQLALVLVLVLVSALAAVGRTVFPFVVGLLLGLPAFAFQVLSLLGVDDPARHHAFSLGFYLAFFLLVVAYMLRYVFNPEVMTQDKLFGAAATYLLLGVLWTSAYDLVQYADPQAFGVRPGEPPRSWYDLLYMSFGLLTSNGPGDLMPTGAKVRALVILEQIAGTLFVAILVARLAGIYPPKRDATRE